MALRSILQLIALRATLSFAQVFDNGPIQLHVTSQVNTSTNGTAPRAANNGFYFASPGQGDYSRGHLSFRAAAGSAYGPIGLIYDPGTNVAVPIFNQTAGAAQWVGFDATTGHLLMAGVDDTTAAPAPPQQPPVPIRSYNNWFLCFVELGGHDELLVAWVLGANMGWEPTNPTCQPVNISMETTAQSYGGSLLTEEELGSLER
ncbi:hypothetical protein F4779DRAFT_624260 [Xylariaceae sp. FL0662B]|nr:hypothetical protein F4779DRAFT_624260 [Xylariaceae sp. FL0662B]